MANPWDNDKIVSGSHGGVFSLPPDESESARIAAERERIRIAQRQAQIAEERAARDELAFKGTHNPDGSPKLQVSNSPKLTAKTREDAIQAYNDAAALERIAANLETQFNEGPGKTHGLAGVQDYLPTAQNQKFDDTSFQARGYVKRGLGFTGGEGNTVSEIGLNYGPYLPEASDRDGRVPGKIAALRELAHNSRTRSIAVLGGEPDANGAVTPVPVPNAMTANRLVDAPAQQAAAFGATTGADAIPPEMANDHAMLLAQLMHGSGKLDPTAYAAARSQLDQKYGFTPNTGEYQKWAVGVNAALAKGGATVPTGITPPEKPLSGIDQARNSAVNNPLGAALVGAADMGSFGGVKALAGDQLGALSDAYPISMTAGQIAGAIGGTGAIAKAGAETFGRAAPSLLGGGKLAQFGRNVGTDALYSGVYGGVSGEGAGKDAALGAVGSVLGQGVGKVAGRMIGGLDTSQAVQALKARAIPMTLPQQLGGFAKSIEDKATSIPFVGDMINARRMDGLRSFNHSAMTDAAGPIGFRPSEVGKGGVDQMVDAVGNAYDQATQGANVPFDNQFLDDMTRFQGAAQQLPRDLRVKAATAVQNRLAPLTDAGSMTGEQYQQAVRGLKGYKAETSKPGFEQDYRDTLNIAQDALTGQMNRGGGAQVVGDLGRADSAYRNIKTVQDAAGRADGAGYIFTPSQLQDAVKKTQGKFPGRMGLGELADTGQQVLPSRVADSGTAGRVAQMAAGGGLMGLGTGAGAALDGGDGAQTGLLSSAALTAILLAGGTKGGQKALEKMLIDRPAWLQTAGRKARRTGLFGSGSVPVALNAGR